MTTSAEEQRRIRYDRQVRLWGSGVQQRLHSILLLVSPGAPFYCDETLKNLVLAGVGKVRILQDDESNETEADKREFFKQSVVVLSGAENASSLSVSKAQAIVDGLRKLNNLVDAAVFDAEEENLVDQHSCVIALVDSTNQNNSWLNKISDSLPKTKGVDIVCHIRLLTQSYSFCEFNSLFKSVASEDDAAKTATSLLLDSPWKNTSPHPPLSVLLSKATSLVRENPKISFEEFVIGLQLDSDVEEAFFHVDSAVIEKVAAECLPSCSTSSVSNFKNDTPHATLNSVVGAVLSQQILSHACNVPPALKQEANNAAGAQPRPAKWIFCSEDPNVECLCGN
jgi:hypothetical protein